MSLKSQIESILFISTRPIKLKRMMELTGGKKDLIKIALSELIDDYDESKGINIQKIGSKYQMVTNSQNSEMISEFLKEEMTGELTPASLETLTVVAYRGPITKTELEMIRGVNCSVILRNLMIRGLVEEKHDKKNMVQTYQITFDFLRHLGITQQGELPEYEKLNSNESLEKLLNPDAEEEKQSSFVSELGSKEGNVNSESNPESIEDKELDIKEE